MNVRVADWRKHGGVRRHGSGVETEAALRDRRIPLLCPIYKPRQICGVTTIGFASLAAGMDPMDPNKP
jgi:hypothetical protein